ncbi:hypothetical protein GGR58DRAFT_475850 [Xylaria digitata]|nr:hypothetical protein GGR58DRAFT_475850 [Xylaria digitata]
MMRPLGLLPNNSVLMAIHPTSCLKQSTASKKSRRFNFQFYSIRHISPQNLGVSRILLPTLPSAGSPLIYRTDEQLQRQTAYRQPHLRNFRATAVTKMASDEDYMAFLNKANQDPNEGYVKPQRSSNGEFKATDDDAKIPAAIQEAIQDAFYVSDADEPFVPVSLAWDEGGKGLPDEEEFATLIHHPDPSKASIEIQDPADWDTQGKYQAILDAVTKAGKGNDVRVYRVAKGGARVEYWIVTTDGKGAGARLVGAKALAIES